MCSDFHVAEAVSLGEDLSAPRPIATLCWLTRSNAALARSVRTVPQPEPGMQSPMILVPAEAAGGLAAPGIAHPATAAISTSSLTPLLVMESTETSARTG